MTLDVPADILHSVIELLPFRNGLPDYATLASLALVNHTWKEAATRALYAKVVTSVRVWHLLRSSLGSSDALAEPGQAPIFAAPAPSPIGIGFRGRSVGLCLLRPGSFH
jgi:hypothetical protein